MSAEASPPAGDRNISTTETAKLLEISPMSVRNLARTGKLAHYKPTKRKLIFRLSEVLKYKQAHTRLGEPIDDTPGGPTEAA